MNRRLSFTYKVEHFDPLSDTLLVTYVPSDEGLSVASAHVPYKESWGEVEEAIVAGAPMERWELELSKRGPEGKAKGAEFEGKTGKARGVDVEQARARAKKPAQAEVDLFSAKVRQKAVVEGAASLALNEGVEWKFKDGQVGRVKCSWRTLAILDAVANSEQDFPFRVTDGRLLPLSPRQARELAQAVLAREDEVRRAQWAVTDQIDMSDSIAGVQAVDVEQGLGDLV